jgi:UDP-3-O-[3-hydroxymyristoyl] glucosamine N-acyltransferase
VKLGAIAEAFDLECRGDPETEISGLRTTEAAAVVVQASDADSTDKPLLISDNPRMAWAQIATLFDPQPSRMPFIEQSASISEQAVLGRGVAIGANVVVRAGAVIGDGAVIDPGCIIGEACIVGAGTRLHPNVVLYHNVSIGESCIIHAGVVIGADGFGFEFDGATGDYVKIPQVYGVKVGNNVEIGAGTTIDRGALNNTTIGDGCKLDNQVQIGHGTQIDHHTVISGCTAIAGSTKIGSYCLIGGAVGIIDNIEIADQVEITAMSLVSQSILDKGRYSSGTGLMPGFEWKRSVVGFRKLDDILKRLKRLESD